MNEVNEQRISSPTSFAMFVASAVLCLLLSALIIGVLTINIWLAPVNAHGWDTKFEDPRQLILGLPVLSLRYCWFNLYLITLLAGSVYLSFKSRVVGPITLKDHCFYSGASALLTTAYGICFGLLAQAFWWIRSLPDVRSNYQVTFLLDLVFAVFNLGSNVVFTYLLFLLMSALWTRLKRPLAGEQRSL